MAHTSDLRNLSEIRTILNCKLYANNRIGYKAWKFHFKHSCHHEERSDVGIQNFNKFLKGNLFYKLGCHANSVGSQ